MLVIAGRSFFGAAGWRCYFAVLVVECHIRISALILLFEGALHDEDVFCLLFGGGALDGRCALAVFVHHTGRECLASLGNADKLDYQHIAYVFEFLVGGGVNAVPIIG